MTSGDAAPNYAELARSKGWTSEMLRRTIDVQVKLPEGTPVIRIPQELMQDPFKVLIFRYTYIFSWSDYLSFQNQPSSSADAEFTKAESVFYTNLKTLRINEKRLCESPKRN